jgi:hypothetical protein
MMSNANSIVKLAHLHGVAEDAGDIDAVMATVSDDPVWEVWPYLRLEGRTAVEAFYVRQLKYFYPRLIEKHSVGVYHAGADTVVHETEFVYESYAGSAITDRAIAFLFLDGKGDRLVTERIYFGGHGFATFFEEKYRDDTEFFEVNGVISLRRATPAAPGTTKVGGA